MKNAKFSQPDLLAVTIKSNFILFLKVESSRNWRKTKQTKGGIS